MTTKQKVAELPQEERDTLINEAKELKIRGVYDTFSVDTLKAKIADCRQRLEGESDELSTATPFNAGKQEAETKGAQQATAGAENEQKSENSEQKSVETKIPEQPKVTKAKGSAYINQTNNVPQKAGMSLSASPNAPAPATKLCHICRSKVINGKCSGCGFEFKK